MADLPLGKQGSYEGLEDSPYRPDLLYPIPRNDNRQLLGLNAEALPFTGSDIWNAYEFSHLDLDGKPVAASLRLEFPADSSHIVESKSLKLYLNSFSFYSVSESNLLGLIQKDLGEIVNAQVNVSLLSLNALACEGFGDRQALGICVDDFELGKSVSFDMPDSALLSLTPESTNDLQLFHSHLFRSLCPVTSQPDWASVVIRINKDLDPSTLLSYLCSYRKHQGFHEDCVERIYLDLMSEFKPEKLSVYAGFTRRGGIDINPFRSNFEDECSFPRISRQ